MLNSRNKTRQTDRGIDASTFQLALGSLAKTVTNLVEREGIKIFATDRFVAEDVSLLIRQSFYIYSHLFYLYSTMEIDPYCLYEYGFVALSEIRVLIDSLYNVVALLECIQNGRMFRADGYRQLFQSIREARQMHADDQDQIKYLDEMWSHYDFSRRVNNISDAEIENGSWPTLSQYLRLKPNNSVRAANQAFLRQFSFGYWKQYSAISHGTFWGLTMVAPFLMRDRKSPEERQQLVDFGFSNMSLHLIRMSVVFLSILSEVQAKFAFSSEGARVPERLKEIWLALSSHSEVKQVFESRYARLLE